MKMLAIIPARGGSKGIPRKNIALLCGKPLISYSIEAAIESGSFIDVLVTSDDDEILATAKKTSPDIIALKRPEVLSHDHASCLDVTSHAIENYIKMGKEKPDAIVLLQPTSPIRDPKQITAAIDAFHSSKAPSLVSVSAPIQHPSDFIYKEQDKWAYCFKEETLKEGRQNFREAWFINGSIYITDTDYLLQNKCFYKLTDCEIFNMPIECSIDIDLPIDLLMATAYLEAQK